MKAKRPTDAFFLVLKRTLASGFRPQLSPPIAHREEFQLPVGTEDVFSTATPTASTGVPYSSATPEFFRLVVPPIWAEGNLTALFPDSRELRRLCARELDSLMRRFSAENLISQAEPLRVPKMPVLDAAAEGIGNNHFADCDLIAVQHLYGSTVGLLDALQTHGLDPSGSTVIGKSYSTHFPAARALRERGYRVPSEPLEQHPVDGHDVLMAETVRAELSRYAERVKRGEAKEKLLLLDDGGQLIEQVHREFPELLSRVVCVEQTTRGIRKVDALAKAGELRTPVVDVAREEVKLDFEMPLVALSAMKEVIRKLTHLRQCGFETGGVISLLGFGNVGRELARLAISMGYQVRVYDPQLTPERARAEGVTLVETRKAFFEGANILLGATGVAPMKLSDYQDLPHRAVLFNCASSNDELASREAIAAARKEQPPRRWWNPLWKKDKQAYLAGLPELLLDREYVLPSTGWLWGEMDGTVLPLGHVARRERRDRVLHFESKDVYLANSGFVTNLTDEADPIPPSFIQVTRAALFSACAEAVSGAQQPGIRDIGESARQRIRSRYLQPDAGGGLPQWRSSWAEHLPFVRPSPQEPRLLDEIFARNLAALTSIPPEDRGILKATNLSPAHFFKDGVDR